MQPWSSEVGSALALALVSTEASKRGMYLDPQSFNYNLDFGTTALGAQSIRTLAMQENAYFAWVGNTATLFNSVDGVNTPFPNDLLRVRYISAERTIGRQRLTATSNPYEGWIGLRNIAYSAGQQNGQYVFLWPMPVVFDPSEEIEFTYAPGTGAGATGTNRLFLTLIGLKLYPSDVAKMLGA